MADASVHLVSRTRRLRPLAWLALAALLALAIALALGSVGIAPDELVAVLLGGGDALHQTLVLELRLPRALAAFGTGALLALAGALMQVLLRNPRIKLGAEGKNLLEVRLHSRSVSVVAATPCLGPDRHWPCSAGGFDRDDLFQTAPVS